MYVDSLFVFSTILALPISPTKEEVKKNYTKYLTLPSNNNQMVRIVDNENLMIGPVGVFLALLPVSQRNV
ncbi:MAG: hypothetical protein PVH61_06805 [Candidatus Aminicenantes bacterium]